MGGVIHSATPNAGRRPGREEGGKNGNWAVKLSTVGRLKKSLSQIPKVDSEKKAQEEEE